MSLLDIAALMRRHVVAVMIVLVLAAVLGYELKHAKPLYNDSATVVFKTSGNPFAFGNGFLVTADLMARSMMSPQSEQRVRQAGGTVDYNVSLVNLYNIEYPYYSLPYAGISVTAPDPVDAARTFSAVMNVLANELKERQAGDGISPVNQIEHKCAVRNRRCRSAHGLSETNLWSSRGPHYYRSILGLGLSRQAPDSIEGQPALQSSASFGTTVRERCRTGAFQTTFGLMG